MAAPAARGPFTARDTALPCLLPAQGRLGPCACERGEGVATLARIAECQHVPLPCVAVGFSGVPSNRALMAAGSS